VQVVKRYKTFLATWKPAGGVIRVVLGDEIRAVLRPGVTEEEIQATAERAAPPGRMTCIDSRKAKGSPTCSEYPAHSSEPATNSDTTSADRFPGAEERSE
jgi:hypothetical protein